MLGRTPVRQVSGLLSAEFFRHEPQPCLGDNRERALLPREQRRVVVAGVVFHQALKVRYEDSE